MNSSREQPNETSPPQILHLVVGTAALPAVSRVAIAQCHFHRAALDASKTHRVSQISDGEVGYGDQ
jgi:hypothetical protein